MRKTARITIIASAIASMLATGSAAMAISVPVHDDGDAPETGRLATDSRQLDAGAAARAVHSRLPGYQLTEMEQETEHGRQFWEVDLLHGAREYEAVVDAAGNVISLQSDDDGGHDADHDELDHDD